MARPTIEMVDEYDVQDTMHALLKLFFDDVRAEEWTPSYAGSHSRMDFLPLVCYVYDPSHRCHNPTALEQDTRLDGEGLRVIVIVSPKGL